MYLFELSAGVVAASELILKDRVLQVWRPETLFTVTPLLGRCGSTETPASPIRTLSAALSYLASLPCQEHLSLATLT